MQKPSALRPRRGTEVAAGSSPSTSSNTPPPLALAAPSSSSSTSRSVEGAAVASHSPGDTRLILEEESAPLEGGGGGGCPTGTTTAAVVGGGTPLGPATKLHFRHSSVEKDPRWDRDLTHQSQRPPSPQLNCTAPIAPWDTALRVAFVSIMAGLMFGILAAITPLLVHYQSLGQDCPRLSEDEPLCGAVPHCEWLPTATRRCDYLETCDNLSEKDCVGRHGICRFVSGRCGYASGWTPAEVGLVASSLTLGGLIGSMVAGSSQSHTRRRDAALAGACSLLGTFGMMASWHWDLSLWIFLFSRTFAGFGVGGVCVIAPIYNAEACPKAWRAQAGALFQVFITFGIALVAKIGYTLENDLRGAQLLMLVCVIVCVQYLVVLLIQHPIPKQSGSDVSDVMDRDDHMENDSEAAAAAVGGGGVERAHLLVGDDGDECNIGVRHTPPPQPQPTGGDAAFGVTLPEDDEPLSPVRPPRLSDSFSHLLSISGRTFVSPGGAAGPSSPGTKTTTAAASAPPQHPSKQRPSSSSRRQKNVFDPCYRKSLLAAAVLSAASQFTGINAVMNYAPSITKSAGFAPLWGNFLVMAWNFVTAILSIPFAKKYSSKTMFLSGTGVVSASCVLCAMGMHPSFFADYSTRTFATTIGIALFILAYELGMGPFFFVLATEVFPAEVKDQGCSVTNVMTFVFNLLVNFGFPVLVALLSGSHTEEVGMAWVFIIFSAVGVVSVKLLLGLLPG